MRRDPEMRFPANQHRRAQGLVQKIKSITAPTPLLGRPNQFTFHRITMHVPQLFQSLLRGPNIEVVETGLPECSLRGIFSEETVLPRVPPLSLRQQSARRALLQHLHHRRRSSDLWLRQEQVHVFRHDNIPDHHEPVALARLFQNREEAVAAARGIQKRQSPVARAGDKVQVMSAVRTMQATGHDKLWYTQHRTRPCQKRKSLP